MPCLALTLEVDAQAAQALSEALLEAGAQAVSIDGLDTPRARLEVLIDSQDQAQRLMSEAARAASLATVPRFATRALPDEDWVRKTHAEFLPVEIGIRLWVGPSWHPPPAHRIALRIDPGLAFGTGSHPTTRLVLAFLERTVRGGERVLDYGCGSGILALAAAKLGAAEAVATDIDPTAVETALANARANGVELNAALPEALPAAVYDIVVSNILAQPLVLLAPLLAARTAPGGRIALAGILESQAAEVAEAYAPWFDAAATDVSESWALVAGVRR